MLKNKFLILILLSGLLLLNPERSFSQGKLEVFGQLKSELSNLKNAEIRIQEDNGIFQKLKFNRAGKFELALPLNHVYTFDFSQAGCISKQIEISTHCPEEYGESVFDPFHFSVLLELYSETPAIDTLFYDRPVGKVYYSEEYKKFGYDRDYILFVQNTIREAIEQQLMASIKRETETNKLLASDALLSNIDSLRVADLHVLENFQPDSAVASVVEKKKQSDSLTSSELQTAITYETTSAIDVELSDLETSDTTDEIAGRTALALADAKTSTQPIIQNPKPEETRNTTKIVPEPAKAIRKKEEIKEAPERKVRPTASTVIKEPERKVRPKENNFTTIPQFKTRPERKTFENTEYVKGLWTRIFINEGSRVTKYTMIQYRNGKTAYYQQDQYQSDSLQISRSVFMRVIK